MPSTQTHHARMSRETPTGSDCREYKERSTLTATHAKNLARPAGLAARILALTLAVFLFLSGCALGPNYVRPKVDVPADFRGVEGAAQQASFADLPWWDVFKDEQLKYLVQTALTNNYSLAIAAKRVEQSRQIAAQARAQYLPAGSYSVRASDGKNEFASVDPNAPGGSKGTFISVVGAAWEADLWGRIRRLNEAARAQY